MLTLSNDSSIPQGPGSYLNGISGLVFGTIVWYIVAVLFGVALLAYVACCKHIFCFCVKKNAILIVLACVFLDLSTCMDRVMEETVGYAVVLSSMTIVGPLAYFGWDPESWKRVFVKLIVLEEAERALLTLSAGAVVGAWFGASPVPLDWERWWQVWPVPSLSGALLGYFIALFVTLVRFIRRRSIKEGVPVKED